MRATSQSTKERDLFRFRSIVFIPCGLEANQEVSHLNLCSLMEETLPTYCGMLQSNTIELVIPTQALGSHDVQVAVRDGLGITSPSERELFELPRDGTLPEINSFLRDRMPQLFNYFARTNSWILTVNSSTWNDGDRAWPYVLLARRTNRTLVPAILNGHTNPSVSDLRDNCGRRGAPHLERVVFLGEIFLLMRYPCRQSLTTPDDSNGPRDTLQDCGKVDDTAAAKPWYVISNGCTSRTR